MRSLSKLQLYTVRTGLYINFFKEKKKKINSSLQLFLFSKCVGACNAFLAQSRHDTQRPVNTSVARVTKTDMNGHHDRVKFDEHRSYVTGSKRAGRVTASVTPNTDHYTDS